MSVCDSDCGVRIEEIADEEAKPNAGEGADGRGIYEHNGVKVQPRQWWVYI